MLLMISSQFGCSIAESKKIPMEKTLWQKIQTLSLKHLKYIRKWTTLTWKCELLTFKQEIEHIMGNLLFLY